MDKALKQRLTSAISRKELANWKKQKNESTLANYQEHEIEKVVEEFNRLNQETLENSKVVTFVHIPVMYLCCNFHHKKNIN
ncbi:hypothetical protein HanPI659440_Chr04g0169981 [Helianthus annuus]|nr:hypothetical protein HanPI659440_Chr04g0169981 [Helianthus annuus]